MASTAHKDFAPADVPAQDDARQRFLLGPARRYVCEAEPALLFLIGRDCSGRLLRQGLRFRRGCRAPKL
jgi:hypothetical protein